MSKTDLPYGFGRAWFAMCVAFALHIVDEGATGFLAVYNPTVAEARARWSWFPMPAFRFRGWLVGLTVVAAVGFVLTAAAARGVRWLRPLAWLFALIMFANAIGHTVFTLLGHTFADIRFPRPAPGFYTSPFLLAGSVWLIRDLLRSSRVSKSTNR